LTDQFAEVITKGDESGNGMIIRLRLPSGLEIIGLPTKNFYGGHWDLGPTWNWLVLADRPFLVDTGRYGQGKPLSDMLAAVGVSPSDLDFVLISHGHEDHDGGLAEFLDLGSTMVRAHRLYDMLIRVHPDIAPPGDKNTFPAKCWHCVMPESFYSKNCLEYHRRLPQIKVTPVGDGVTPISNGFQTYHLPGHSPDCLAVMAGNEALLVGDIILPDISPWPTFKALYDHVAEIISSEYPVSQAVFGLGAYLRTLKKLLQIAEQQPNMIILPAHRLYYRDQWNIPDLKTRVRELLDHHVERCAAILEILNQGPQTPMEIAQQHFDEDLLKGFGSMMAANEMISHLEFLEEADDVKALDDGRYERTGDERFETKIHTLQPDY
jgi:glyoxylase-like metal-dependent hydrolase (beta-lactamase superfamily II)